MKLQRVPLQYYYYTHGVKYYGIGSMKMLIQTINLVLGERLA